MSERDLTASKEQPAHILVVDDEPFVRNAFQLYLETQGYRVSAAQSGAKAIEIFEDKSSPVDIVLLDLVMPGMYGIEVLKQVKETDQSVEVIIATGCGTVHSAIEAMRFGAFDYITKPIVNFEEDLLKVVRAALATRRERLAKAAAQKIEKKAPSVVRMPLPLGYYESLDDLAEVIVASRTHDDFVPRLLEFCKKHLKAESLLLFQRDKAGQPKLVLSLGATCVDTNSEHSEHSEHSENSERRGASCTQFLTELENSAPAWRTICTNPPELAAQLCPGCDQSGTEEPKGEGIIHALRLPLGNETEYECILLRSPDPSGATTFPDSALLRVVLGAGFQMFV